MIDGQKDYPPAARVKRRLFTKTGLLIVFHLLASGQARNATYRELAETLDVSLGSVTNVMRQLQEKGFLLKTSRTQWRLHKKEELLQNWISAYAEQWQPELLLGRFRFADRSAKWEEIKLPPKTCWSGEPAAWRRTRYLSPAELTLYTNQDIRTLMKSMRLLPEEKGNVLAYRKFWDDTLLPPKNELAPDLLIYSDLIASGEGRNFETAQIIYDEFLKDQF